MKFIINNSTTGLGGGDVRAAIAKQAPLGQLLGLGCFPIPGRTSFCGRDRPRSLGEW
ncbi:MAG: hypothetical protein KME14_23755 [Tildeniella torsiva UHER 1998/13D]|nr:hypothetical protein [Tildeniella torsiva UHER 1998/13D]